MGILAPPGVRETAAEEALREQLSNLQGLLMLSMLMTESGDEQQILHLASTSVPSFGSARLEGVYLADRRWTMTQPRGDHDPTGSVETAVVAQLSRLDAGGGLLSIPGRGWAWALALRGLSGHVGHLVVSAGTEPPAGEQFLLRVLARHTGVALVNARLHASERAAAQDLAATNATLAATVRALEHSAEDLAAANAAQAATLRALERSTAIHSRLTRVAVAGEGQQGLARAVHELTGLPVAVEDRYGNLRAWAGPDMPVPYPKDPLARREQMLRRVLREGGPVREGGRLLAVANPRHDVLGVLVLVDPSGLAGEAERVALEHGATVLAMELARLRSLADTELRVRRELVEELLAGTDEDSALSRAQALGYDLERPHRVVVVDGRARTRDDDAFFHVVRRVARDAGLGTLMVARGTTVVVLSDADQSWEDFGAAILGDLGGGWCKVGVGGRCDRPAEIPRSYREAKFALRLQDAARGTRAATSFDDLGVYRILSEVNDTAGVEAFVRSWLGSLLDYDARKHCELVATLSRYLECGGSYEATAAALTVHRSTLKYRLQRIREISGLDLTEADARFNLQLATRAWRTLTALRSEETTRSSC